MRSKLIASTLVAASSLLSTGAFAAACTASATLIPGMQFGDLCTATDQLVQTCGDTTTIGNARDAIYLIRFGAVNSGTITVIGTGFDPYVALMNGPACNSLNACRTEEIGVAGSQVVLNPADNIPAGDYYLFITESSGSAACGAFTVTTLPFPVSLQKFSVE